VAVAADAVVGEARLAPDAVGHDVVDVGACSGDAAARVDPVRRTRIRSMSALASHGTISPGLNMVPAASSQILVKVSSPTRIEINGLAGCRPLGVVVARVASSTRASARRCRPVRISPER